MTKPFLAALAAAALLLPAGAAQAHPGDPGGDRRLVLAPSKPDKKAGTVDLQLLTVSDWHGQLPPLGSGAAAVGGAPALKAYFDAARAEQPNTLTFMAGDSVGASPPVSSFFADEPAIRAMNAMGVDADTLGNHNFDAGIERLRRHAEIAEFPFVSANLAGLEEEAGIAKRVLRDVDGVRVAIIGITNEEAPGLVAPGNFGSLRVLDGVAAADKAARQARNAGAQVVVVLTHKGIRGRDAEGRAFGELVDFAEAVDERLVDVVVGDHTDFQYSGLHDGVLAVENRSKGATFAKVGLTVDRRHGVVSKGVEFVVPLVSRVTPDPELQAYLGELERQLAPVLGQVLGSSGVRVPRSDACGRGDGRLCESLLGNLVTDALRATYGTQLALTNSGGLRAELTCPGAGTAAFCPAGTVPPPFPITRGGTLGVLPFGNTSATATVTGADVRRALENGVSRMPAADGRFPQVSGLCFTYDLARPAGDRVTRTVLQAPDGTCSGEPLQADRAYTLTTNDFVAFGGDGYPNIGSRVVTRDLMEADVARYVAERGTVAPALQGRISCVGAGCPTPVAG
jgi:2',3'-cyclic-nucleotide 2'-phosphodiesterase (5'-nucleotidase family)